MLTCSAAEVDSSLQGSEALGRCRQVFLAHWRQVEARRAHGRAVSRHWFWRAMRPFSVKVRPLATRPAGARPAPQTATTLWLVFVTAQATAGRSAATVHALQPAGPGTGSTALQRSMEPAIGATTDSETCRLVERREDIAVKVARRRRDEIALAFAQLAQVTRPRPSWDKIIVLVLTRILLNVGPLAIVVVRLSFALVESSGLRVRSSNAIGPASLPRYFAMHHAGTVPVLCAVHWAWWLSWERRPRRGALHVWPGVFDHCVCHARPIHCDHPVASMERMPQTGTIRPVGFEWVPAPGNPVPGARHLGRHCRLSVPRLSGLCCGLQVRGADQVCESAECPCSLSAGPLTARGPAEIARSAAAHCSRSGTLPTHW